MAISFRVLYSVGFLLMYAVLGLLMTLAAAPVFITIERIWNSERFLISMWSVSMCFLMGMTLLAFVTAAFIRVLGTLLPIREGAFSVYSFQMINWGVQYFLMTFINTMFLPILRTTPLLSLFYRLLGARVSSSVLFNSSLIYEPHLVEIGDNSRIGENAVLVPHTTEGKTFICRKIRIGKNVTIGQYAQILPGATIGDNVIVGAGAVVSKGKIIRDNSIAWGNPLQIKSITPQELVANS